MATEVVNPTQNTASEAKSPFTGTTPVHMSRDWWPDQRTAGFFTSPLPCPDGRRSLTAAVRG